IEQGFSAAVVEDAPVEFEKPQSMPITTEAEPEVRSLTDWEPVAEPNTEVAEAVDEESLTAEAVEAQTLTTERSDVTPSELMPVTPTFKMGALQLRPTSRIVSMRLAPSQQPQTAMNLQVTFEISKIQPQGGGLGQVRLTPSQQQRPTITGSPSFTVGGLQLISNFEAAPVQLTPSQQASVL